MARARTAWLRLACVALIASGVGARASADPNLIAAENARAGDPGWRLRQRAAPGQLEAYAGATSVQHGEAVAIHARADGAHTLRWSAYRMGWYGGAEGRLLASGGPVPVGPQPTPAPAAGTLRVECTWPVTFTIQTEASWTSGVYVVKLVREDGPQQYAIFVVRADERKGVGVLQASVSTYQAYNPWGGTSLYVGRAWEVSYDRPYGEGVGAGQYFRYEHEFVKWAEARGFDLTYLTNVDVDRDASLLLGQRIFLSVGHDEYWSRAERQAVEAAVASGVNLAFFSANTGFWQMRLEPGRASGAPRRTEVCYKNDAGRADPQRGTPTMTVQFRDPRVAWPENALLGVMYSAWQPVDTAWVVRNARAWPYEGTGLQDGDTLPLIVGYESDRTFDANLAGAQILAHSPTVDFLGRPDLHEASVRQAPSGAFVFAAGTIQWSWGLAREGTTDERVQRITENVLRRAGLVPASPPPGVVAGGPPAPNHDGAVSSVWTFAGKPYEEGLRDGPAATALFRRPTAAALDADGNLYVADTGNHAIRRIANDAAHTVTTLVGDGTEGDGEGVRARLRWPQGIAVLGDGTVVVSDSANHRIVKLRRRDAGWAVETFAGVAGWNDFVDGAPTVARFSNPGGMAVVGSDLYVADRESHRIRRVDATGRVSSIAGGVAGYQDGSGGAAQFRYPSDVIRSDRGLLVVDSLNRAVRLVSLGGAHEVTTVAGNPDGGARDGAISEARFQPSMGLFVDADGAILVADGGNARIRRIASGEVRTYAGSGASGASDGSGATARLSFPTGFARMPDGDLLVVDQGSSTLRLLSGRPPPPAQSAGASASVGASRAKSGCASAAEGAALSLAGVLLALAAGRRARVRGGARGRPR